MSQSLAIAFSLSKAWSYRAKKDAIDQAGSFAKLAEASQKKFESIDLKSSEAQIKKIEKLKGWLWIYGTPEYPTMLAKIPNPPLVVYGLGKFNIDEVNTLGFIGSRTPTPYGKRIGSWLAKDLLQEGLTLVSGLARGIDSVAHKAGIDVKAPTVAVLAHGLDMVYPPENKKLAQQIVETGGTIISEFPFGIKPLPAYFSQRNRMISGLSQALLVVEAAEKSGTRLTVNHAIEQSREVFAVPGPIDSEYSAYTNELIFSGANMVRSSQDLLSFFPQHQPIARKKTKTHFKPSRLQFKIMQFLDKDKPRSIEEFVVEAKVDLRQALQSLTELELYGKVVKQSNSTYLLAQ